jgi:dipeptidyl-peptidase-4
LTHSTPRTFVRSALVVSLAGGLITVATSAQDRLKGLPGYEQYQKVSAQLAGAVQSGQVNGTWNDDSNSFEYVLGGKRYRFDVAARSAVEIGVATFETPATGRGGTGRGGTGLERGRQAGSAAAPDGKLKAFYREEPPQSDGVRKRNLWLSDAKGASEIAITTDGSDRARIKYGTASWVYGEELGQTTAMWWSPDSRKIAYYRFDEKGVLDYHLQLDQTKVQSTDNVEAYPKAGAPNPVVDVWVYDVATKKSNLMDVRDGKPFDDAAVGHYVYRVSWSADGRELLFNRTNRRQNILEFVAANPETGRTRVIVREEWPTGWVNNRPSMQFLEDNRRFIWESERNGFANLYLYDLSGRLITPLTSCSCIVSGWTARVTCASRIPPFITPSAAV